MPSVSFSRYLESLPKPFFVMCLRWRTWLELSPYLTWSQFLQRLDHYLLQVIVSVFQTEHTPFLFMSHLTVKTKIGHFLKSLGILEVKILINLWVFVIFVVAIVWDKVSLYSPGWPWTQILLPHPPECCSYRCTSSHPEGICH
jgi:hypothetical protein